MPVRKKPLLLFLALLAVASFFSTAGAESVDVNHFLLLPTASGTSGYIDNPAAYVLANKQFTLGLHMDTYVFKFNYGFLDFMEAGMVVDFGKISDMVDTYRPQATVQGFWNTFVNFCDSISESTNFDFKCQALKEEDYFVSVAAGIKKFPLSMFERAPWNDFALYAVASKKVTDMSLSMGVEKTLGHNYTGFVADVSKVVADTVLLVGEYDEDRFNIGAKVSLNYNVDVEFYIRNITNVFQREEIGDFLQSYFVFGISYLQ